MVENLRQEEGLSDKPLLGDILYNKSKAFLLEKFYVPESLSIAWKLKPKDILWGSIFKLIQKTSAGKPRNKDKMLPIV